MTRTTQAIDKFGARWRALKPQEMKDWTAGEVDRVFAALDDWREQFTEHKNKVGVGTIPTNRGDRMSG